MLNEVYDLFIDLDANEDQLIRLVASLLGVSDQDSALARQKVQQGWSADFTQSGADVTAAGASWNSTLAPGQSADIGFNGSHTGTNNAPTAFAVNGSPCTIG